MSYYYKLIYSAEHISEFGDLINQKAVHRLYLRMLESKSGSRILEEKPKITDINLNSLESLSENTLGARYLNFYKRNNLIDNSRYN